MKRSLSLIALATLATGTAFAQSSVTVYGRVNTSIERQKAYDPVLDAAATSTVMQDNSSRWGLKGTEDLGGGLKASFLLEGGFDSSTGAGAGGFGRESWVALESASAGKLRLGNVSATAAYFATADYISLHNHDTGTSADAFYLYQGNSTNTVAYTSPSFSGFQAELQYGLKETTANRNTTVLALNYDAGPLHIGGGYVNGTDNYLGGDRAKQFGLRGLYEMGALTLGAYFINDKVDFVDGDVKRNAYRLSAQYNIGAGELHANLGFAGKLKAAGTTLDGTDARQFTLGYNHNLSKRTKVYAFYTRIDNKEFAAYALGGGQAPELAGAVRGAGGIDPSSLAIGIRHNF